MNDELNRMITGTKVLGVGLASLLVVPHLTHAQDSDWEPTEGYGDEEWYDPSDWFDGDSTDSDYEYDDYDYYDGYWDGYTWYDDYDYTSDYGTEYLWDDTANEWETAYDDDMYSSASYDFNEGSSSQKQNQQSSQNRSQQKGTKTLQGTIEGFRQVELTHSTGYEETHALARISLDTGEKAVIDLGLASLLNEDISKGNEVTLKGSEGEIDGQKVFVATELTTNGETVYIDRAIQRQQRSSGGSMASSQSGSKSSGSKKGRQSQGQMLTVEGKVAEIESVQVQGSSERQQFAKIELENGKAATVKLGSETSVQELDIQKGDRIRIKGDKQKIEGKNVIAARSISVEGEQVKG